jgi:hypothetical protein
VESAALAELEDRLRTMGGVQVYWAGQVHIQRLAVGGWIALLHGDTTEALRQAAEAAMTEDITEKHPVTPGPVLPARELYADLLRELRQSGEAEAHYRAVLARQPNRLRAMRHLELTRTASGNN